MSKEEIKTGIYRNAHGGLFRLHGFEPHQLMCYIEFLGLEEPEWASIYPAELAEECKLVEADDEPIDPAWLESNGAEHRKEYAKVPVYLVAVRVILPGHEGDWVFYSERMDNNVTLGCVVVAGGNAKGQFRRLAEAMGIELRLPQ